MARTQSTVLIRDIPTIMADPARGSVSLVGEHGGLSCITEAFDPAYTGVDVMGALVIRTEHGDLIVDPYDEVVISESAPADARTAESEEEEA